MNLRTLTVPLLALLLAAVQARAQSVTDEKFDRLISSMETMTKILRDLKSHLDRIERRTADLERRVTALEYKSGATTTTAYSPPSLPPLTLPITTASPQTVATGYRPPSPCRRDEFRRRLDREVARICAKLQCGEMTGSEAYSAVKCAIAALGKEYGYE